MSRKVLLLNNTYEPLGLTSVRSVMKKIANGSNAIKIEEYYEDYICTVNQRIAIPSVVRLNRYINTSRIRNRKSFNRIDIYQRDEFTCVYCGDVFGKDDLTLDHILPKSRHGGNDYSNLATSCKPCNNRKGDRTPEEAGMALLRKIPKSFNPVATVVFKYKIHDSWRKYLYV